MSDPTLYLYTSLTAGSSHIVTATARVETILKANKLPFRVIDVATDDVARKLWGRRAKGKKLPGLVKYGDVVGDLEQIEEWNEFGELRLVVNSVQDLGGMPATSYATPAPTETKDEPKSTETSAPITPKPSTIKIQSPPTTKTEDKKDEQAVLALRQASEEAASKAKTKTDDEKKEKDAAVKEEPKQEDAGATTKPKVHRGSVAAELPDPGPESPKAPKRPPLVPEVAAVSSANFHADNAEALGLVEHHRGSLISTGSKEEQEKMVHEIRQSISAERPDGALEALRKEAAEKPQEAISEEEPTPSAEETAETDMKDVKAERDTKDVKPDTDTKDVVKVETDTKDVVKAEIPDSTTDNTQEQDPKSAEAATTAVKD